MARKNADWLQGLEIDARGNQAIVSKKENNPTAECGREEIGKNAQARIWE